MCLLFYEIALSFRKFVICLAAGRLVKALCEFVRIPQRQQIVQEKVHGYLPFAHQWFYLALTFSFFSFQKSLVFWKFVLREWR